MVGLTALEVRGLCLKCREIFLSQPMLLELEAPIKICGKSLFSNSPNLFDSQNSSLFRHLK